LRAGKYLDCAGTGTTALHEVVFFSFCSLSFLLHRFLLGHVAAPNVITETPSPTIYNEPASKDALDNDVLRI